MTGRPPGSSTTRGMSSGSARDVSGRRTEKLTGPDRSPGRSPDRSPVLAAESQWFLRLPSRSFGSVSPEDNYRHQTDVTPHIVTSAIAIRIFVVTKRARILY